jgi:alkaline phosphatase
MKKYDMKKVINSHSWKKGRNKIVDLSAIMPAMDKDVLLNRIKQFPEFTKFAFEVLNVMEKEHETTITTNNKNQENVHESFQETKAILEKQLNKDGVTQDEKNRIYEQLAENDNKELENDSNNKKFLYETFNKVILTSVSLSLTAIVFVGGEVMIKRR